jgi:hypothetical protein
MQLLRILTDQNVEFILDTKPFTEERDEKFPISKTKTESFLTVTLD